MVVLAIIVQYLTSCLQKHDDGSTIWGLKTSAGRIQKQGVRFESNFVCNKLDVRGSTGAGVVEVTSFACRLENPRGWIEGGGINDGARAIVERKNGKPGWVFELKLVKVGEVRHGSAGDSALSLR